RRLARAGGADEGRELPLLDRQVDAAQRVHGGAVAAEDLGELAGLDDPGHGGSSRNDPCDQLFSSSFSTFLRDGSSRQTCWPGRSPERTSTRSKVAMPALTGTTSK